MHPFLAILSLVAIYAFVHFKNLPRGKPLPGPPSVPLLGNALQLPRTKVWEKLHEWSQTYGPIYSLRLFSTPLIVLNTVEAGCQLLEGKSALYANRPLPKMVSLCGFDKGVVLEHDPNRLRQARKLLHSVLQANQVPQYREMMLQHIDDLLYNMLCDPEHFVQHIRHLTAGITMEVSHGHRVQSRDDPYVLMANEFADNFAEATMPNNHVVDWLPFLAKLPSCIPGLGFKAKASSWRKQYFSLAEEGHRMVKDDIAKSAARPSLTYKALVESKRGEYSDDIIMFTATQVYTGGADTTVSTLSSVILFMLQHPEVQKRAQEELDRAVYTDRLPSHQDVAALPYTEAIMFEVLRLRPPVSIVLRMAGEDDNYDGRLIEKNTTVLTNIWGMMRDEAHYPEPNAFKPERWFGRDRHAKTHPFNVVFGFGRRICPGRHLAVESMFTTIARILLLFDIYPLLDTNGRPVIPTDDSTNGSITYPVPFRCNISPRSEEARQVIQDLAHEHE